jgi:hypothetical protein
MAERASDVCGQYRRRVLAHLIDVGRRKEADTNLIEPQRGQIFRTDMADRPLRNFERARVLPKRVVVQQARQITPDLV